MAILWLVRHGQVGSVTGHYDTLSSLGFRQAQTLANYFNRCERVFDACYSGTLERQRKTRDVILDHLRDVCDEVAEEVALNEIPFQELFSDYVNEFSADPLVLDFKNADDTNRITTYFRLLRKAIAAWQKGKVRGDFLPWSDFKSRLVQWAKEVQTTHGKHDNILAVSSGGAMGTILSYLLKAPPATMIEMNFQIRNTAYCEVAFNTEYMKVVSFNNIDHFSVEERPALLTGV